MNILMLVFKDIHYDARVQREAIALAEAGNKVTIACLEEYMDEPPFLHDNIQQLRISLVTKRMKRNMTNSTTIQEKRNRFKAVVFKIVRNPLVKLTKDVWANREYYKKIENFLKNHSNNQNQAPFIHCHDLNTLPVGYFLSKKFSIPIVYDSHELFNEMAGKNPVERQIGFWLEKQLIKKVAHLIVVNSYVEEIFHQRYGAISSTVIQNTPILPDAQELEKEKQNYWRVKYRLNESDVLLLYQGGLTPERGIEECILAVKQLPEQYKLVLLGDGRIKNELLQLVQSEKLAEKVFFHEQVPAKDILWYTKQADIGLVMYKNTCPNNYYSTPNKIFEYMMAGIPTVASNHPGKKYIVEVEKTGVCVEETPNAIMTGIDNVVANYNGYKQNCMEKREAMSWQTEAIKLVELYKDLGEKR